MKLQLKTFSDPREFVAVAFPFLLEREAQHCVMLGLTQHEIDRPGSWPNPANFVAILDERNVVAAAVRTPPHEPTLSFVAVPDAIPLIVDFFLEQPDVGGASGEISVVNAFAEEWWTRTGQVARTMLSGRIHQVTKVVPPRWPPGKERAATREDYDLLRRWSDAFVRESLPDRAVPGAVERALESRLGGSGGYRIWEDGEPVCMAGFTGRTPNGMRIAPVYTPPQFRSRGYAKATTAALSQQLLDDGCSFVALYTDLENPVANHVYASIGYTPVADTLDVRFDGARSGGDQ